MCVYVRDFVIWFKLLLQSLFQSMKLDDWSWADPSAHLTLCRVTPAAGWTVDQEKTNYFYQIWVKQKQKNDFHTKFGQQGQI